jgi:hypothetical protein
MYSKNAQGLGIIFPLTSHGEAKQYPDNPGVILLVQ